MTKIDDLEFREVETCEIRWSEIRSIRELTKKFISRIEKLDILTNVERLHHDQTNSINFKIFDFTYCV
jgi:hypothetical protein